MIKHNSTTIAIAVLLLVLTGTIIPTMGTASATSSISKTKSGLVVSDSLTTGNMNSWSFGGTATSYNYYEDSQGLHLGVQAPQSGQWINYYAHLPQPNAYLFHSVITIPDTSVSDGVSNVGLYVEGADYIPHVGCEAYADSTGYYWDVEQSSDAGNTYQILYISQPSSMPQTQDCTIITNGSNYLKVYIGGNLVYSSTTMSLGMSGPFIAFFQGDTSSSSSMHYGIYSDYYVTTNGNVQVKNNPTNAATVSLVDSSGTTLTSSSVTSGSATLNVGKYHYPLAATLYVKDSSGSIITSSPESIYGGDVYTVTTSTTAPQPPTNLSASSVSSSQINLSWITPSDNGGSAITGYKVERSPDGSRWSTIISNTGNTGTTYSDTGLSPNTTYTYRVSAINAIGSSLPSNIASATTNIQMTAPQPPTGLVATTISSSEIDLSWTAPGNNGGSVITGYQIERSPDGSTWSTLVSNTGSTATTYSNTGLPSSTTYTYRVSAINSVGISSPSNTTSATTSTPPLSIHKVLSGLVANDPLNNQTQTQQQLQNNQKYWKYGGDAIAMGANYAYFEDTQGLHVGVQAPSSGTWAGIYAVTPATNATLFDSIVSTPSRTTSSNFYENGMYVQTAASQNVNYVTCFADTGTAGTEWAIVSATGNVNGAVDFNLLYVDQSPNQPLTRDCTIITNGNNYLKAYIDGTKVYENSTMNLQMPGPFNVFEEPQSSYSGSMLNGLFSDYYATSNENIQVNSLPSNAARVDLVNTSGTVIVSGTPSAGSVTMPIGNYHFPLVGIIKVYDSSNNVITSTPTAVNIFGGDVYSVS